MTCVALFLLSAGQLHDDGRRCSVPGLQPRLGDVKFRFAGRKDQSESDRAVLVVSLTLFLSAAVSVVSNSLLCCVLVLISPPAPLIPAASWIACQGCTFTLVSALLLAYIVRLGLLKNSPI